MKLSGERHCAMTSDRLPRSRYYGHWGPNPIASVSSMPASARTWRAGSMLSSWTSSLLFMRFGDGKIRLNERPFFVGDQLDPWMHHVQGKKLTLRVSKRFVRRAHLGQHARMFWRKP